MSHTILYDNAPKHPKRCDWVRYDPKTYVGVKKDPKTCLTWLIFGPVIRVKITCYTLSPKYTSILRLNYFY